MFDRYVQGTKPSWKRRAVLTVSLALHGIAALVLIVYSFVHVEEITPPALSLTFFSAPPPPPPPPPPASHKKVEHKIEKKIVTPTTVPQLVQPKQEEEKDEDKGEEGGVEGGVAGGVAGGTVGGVVGGTGAPPPKAKNVPPMKLEQEKLSGEMPHLPDIVKIQRKGTGEATAMVKICIDQGGHVNQVSIIQGIPGADAAILSAVRS
jgi:periplasmic protein TonB